MNELKKILICIPSCGFIKTETVASLVNLLGSTPVNYQFYAPMSCYIHMNREESVQRAFEMGADYILFIDADMIFPTDALTKLLNLDKDIASVTYNYRRLPQTSIVTLDEKYDADYQDVDDTKTKDGQIPLSAIKNPFRVKACGGGFLLIKMDVFNKIKRPWFFFEPETETTQPVGEDVWFCDRARELGYEIWIDPSIEMGHVGNIIY